LLQLERVIAAIRTKHLLKFEEDYYKELLTAEEISRRKVEAVEGEIQRVKELYNEKTIEIHNTYQRELEAAQGNKEKMIEAEKKFNKDIEEQTKKRDVSIEGIQKEHNKHVLAEQKKVVDEMRKLHMKMAEDLISNLKSKYKDLKSEVENLLNDLKSLDEEYHQGMRELEQGTMTDYYKWQDDKVEYHRLMNEGRETGDDAYYKKAMDLAHGLAREITDENGKVVISHKSATETSKALYEAAYKARKKLMEQTVEDKKQEAKEVKESIQEVITKLEEYKKAIGTANEEKLRLDLSETINSLTESHNLVSDFKTKWDKLESKTITLTVKIDNQGNASAKGSDNFSEISTVPDEKKKGGFIERLTRGRKLPGFGGGDKIRALLEAGEWVIKKEAVKKYGSSLFEALNNMTFNIEDLLGGAMKRMGGMIPQPAPVKYQSGGEVSIGSRESAGNTYNITFSPQFMTGDEMSMRAMAPELKRVLEDLDHRWGN